MLRLGIARTCLAAAHERDAQEDRCDELVDADDSEDQGERFLAELRERTPQQLGDRQRQAGLGEQPEPGEASHRRVRAGAVGRELDAGKEDAGEVASKFLMSW